METLADDKKEVELEAAREIFLANYEPIMDYKQHIFQNTALGSSPLNWYISQGRMTFGRSPESITLGQLLFILENLEERNGGKRIHRSWLQDKEAWDELIKFTVPEVEPDLLDFNFPSMWPLEKTAVQLLKEQAVKEEPASSLFLSMEEVVEELKSPLAGEERRSEKLLHFEEALKAAKEWMGDDRWFGIYSGTGSKLVLKMGCGAHKLDIPNSPGPVNFTWRVYDDEWKALVQEAGSQFSVSIKEKKDSVHFRKAIPMEEALSRGPESVMAWMKEVLETFDRKLKTLNGRFAHKIDKINR